jgi:hypothetical protein
MKTLKKLWNKLFGQTYNICFKYARIKKPKEDEVIMFSVKQGLLDESQVRLFADRLKELEQSKGKYLIYSGNMTITKCKKDKLRLKHENIKEC